jgi:hypothetical protein
MLKQKKIRGFLLVFIVLLVVINPILSIKSLCAVLVISGPYLTEYSAIKLIVIIKFCFTIGIIIFGIYIGIILWQVRLNAVKKTKFFLLTILIFTIIGNIVPFVHDWPINIHTLLTTFALKNIITNSVFVFGSYLYFVKSERIRKLYEK